MVGAGLDRAMRAALVRDAMARIERMTTGELRRVLASANPFADYSRDSRVALQNTLLRYELGGGPLLDGEGWTE